MRTRELHVRCRVRAPAWRARLTSGHKPTPPAAARPRQPLVVAIPIIERTYNMYIIGFTALA